MSQDRKHVARKQSLGRITHDTFQAVHPGGYVAVLPAADGIEIGPAAVVIVAAAHDPLLRKPEKDLVVRLADRGYHLEGNSIDGARDGIFCIKRGGRKKRVDAVTDGVAFPDPQALGNEFFIGQSIAELTEGPFV